MEWIIAQVNTEKGVTGVFSAVDQTLPWVKAVKEFAAEHAVSFGIRLLAALAILFIGRIVIGILMGFVSRGMQRASTDEMLVRFVQNVLKAVLLVVVVMASLQTLGVELTSLTAILAAAGFAVGMALQGSLSNFAAGIMLVVVKPFHAGDFIDVAGVSGTVQEVRLFSCSLKTFDGLSLTIPNGQITSGVIKNYSSEPNRLINLVIGCGYGDDLLAVKNLLLEIISSHEKVLTDPEPLVAVDELGASSVNLVVRPWVRNEDFGSVKRQLTEQIKLAFDEHGFTFPYPSQDVYLHNDATAEG
ncbi:mechanosensitive ion channel family protein [Thalassoglobus polymorphus]|uniref:Small-conductance mechanosensitive channel n=1 Tax=Thalassoglobus polymorphus TaxID=2527994 RepID=A0A517QIY9_9PLAN|nr:mechanosensitive ion channel domain-containing protein [Thalassoglobus polymorphus]QDT31545.1 Small-conductance mechanosensitive channel [Thalassoglobus polymorphus]